MLLDHFAKAHDWPCTTKVRAATTTDSGDDENDCEFNVNLRYGFNFLIADCATDDGSTNNGSYLFLLKRGTETAWLQHICPLHPSSA
jgi:E3 ubiquitin-protein ligase SIAH1